jgi:hypothetical protein
MKKITLIFSFLFVIFVTGIYSQNAPVTMASNISSCTDISIDIPITVADFFNIGALSLTMNYNSSVLTFESYTNNSGFPGLVVNGSIPGLIIAGGYINAGDPGILLPDNAVLFTLTFHYLGGYTDLIWNDNGESCEYTDNIFNPLNDLPATTYYLNGSVSPIQPVNAPITTAPNITICPDTYVEIPITVSDFCKIGALSLTMNYNSSALLYQSFTNDSGFPGLVVNGSIPGSIIAGGYINPGDPGISLPDNSVLFTLTFLNLGGSTGLTWYDDGESCEYTDNLFIPLDDSPATSYYLDGSVTPYQPLNAPVTTAPHIIAYAGTIIEIPITVSDFCKIGALSLTMNYISSVLSFQSFTNDSGFPGLVVNGSIPGSIIAGGYLNPGDPGYSIHDNSVLFTLTFLYLGGSTGLTWYDDGESCEYTDNLFNPLNDSPTHDYYINGSVAGSINLELEVFIEGPFGGTDMSTDLNPSFLPQYQPYNTSPWNYAGSENIGAVPNGDVVDWVLVELRETAGSPSAATADTRISRQAGLLLKNGVIVGTDGASNLSFNVLFNDDLYVVVWHRNHLGVMSAVPVIQSGNIHTYDFTSGETQVYGGSLGHKEITSGVWGMCGGDGNGDGTINNGDKINLWDNQTGTKGYILSDYTMDSQSNNLDKNDIWFKNVGVDSKVP